MDVLSLSSIIISVTLGLPTFLITILGITRRLLVIYTFKCINSTFELLEVVNVWNNKIKNEKWEDFANDLLQQGVLWFVSREMLLGFISPYTYTKVSILEVKDTLKDINIWYLFNIFYRWKKLYKKCKNVIDVILKFGFIVSPSIFFQSLQYNMSKFNYKTKIEKTTISFIPNLDNCRLFGSKFLGSSQYNDGKISLKSIKKKNVIDNKRNWRELKNKKYFIFNIKFKWDNDDFCPLFTYSIHFELNKIKKIETYYDFMLVNIFNDNSFDQDQCIYFINCIKTLKSMFKIENISDYLSDKWKENNKNYNPFIIDKNFLYIKKEIKEF